MSEHVIACKTFALKKKKKNYDIIYMKIKLTLKLFLADGEEYSIYL
jgi:hypothetical protein